MVAVEDCDENQALLLLYEERNVKGGDRAALVAR